MDEDIRSSCYNVIIKVIKNGHPECFFSHVVNNVNKIFKYTNLCAV